MVDSSTDWKVHSSAMGTRTFNPIRHIVDDMPRPQGHAKSFIPLSIGDPTVFKNLSRSPEISKAISNVLESSNFDGYPPSTGYVLSRKAVAEFLSSTCGVETSSDDIILTSGCSHALDMVISSLCNPGDQLLIPAPGFSLYRTICESYGFDCIPYPLQSGKSWEVDLALTSELVTSKCRGILINNPSNPCGSCYSREHIMAILSFAEKYQIPIIADEIYANMTFNGRDFFSFGQLSERVPIISVGGIAKQFLVPGYRLGWIALYDRCSRLSDFSEAIHRISQRILGPNSLIQAALPQILGDTPAEYFVKLNAELAINAKFCVERLSAIPGLVPVAPQGAMYVMVEILLPFFKDFESDTEFASALLLEQNVMVLPGKGFGAPNFFRIVFSAPMDMLSEAVHRIQEFCVNHHLKKSEAHTTIQ